jgi:hypothetical protein
MDERFEENGERRRKKKKRKKRMRANSHAG